MSARSRLRTYLVRLSDSAPTAILALGVVLVCLLLTVGLGPFTPLELDRAEASLARGEIEPALRSCDLSARWALREPWRQRARYRAAAIRAHQLEQPALAVSELRSLLRRGVVEPQLETLSLILLAESLERRGRYRLAAERYEQLARTAPRPAPWLEAAALAWERAGRPDRALLRQAAVPLLEPEMSDHALLAMGRVALGLGRADKAYAYYAEALEADSHLDHARLARLGMAMALEAMGQVEQALAELDEAAPEGDAAIGIARSRVQRRAEEEQGSQ